MCDGITKQKVLLHIYGNKTEEMIRREREEQRRMTKAAHKQQEEASREEVGER